MHSGYHLFLNAPHPEVSSMDLEHVPLCPCQMSPREHKEIIRYDATPYILFEPLPAGPGTAVKTEGPLQGRDASLDPSPEVAQRLVHPCAPRHIKHRKPPLLRKNGVLHLPALRKRQVVMRSKPSIGADFQGHPPVQGSLPLEQRLIPLGIRRIAPLNHTVQNHVGTTTGKKHLVPVL